MSLKSTWSRTPSWLKRTTATITIVASIVATYSAVNELFGVTIRPAWAWELQELNRNQLETTMDLQRINRRDATKELAQYLSMREDYLRNNQPIPRWLTDVISGLEEDLKIIDETIQLTQDRIIELER